MCNGDHKICAVLACAGKIYFGNEAMACHRVVLHEGNSWSAKMYNKNMLLSVYTMYREVQALIKTIYNKDIGSMSVERHWYLESKKYMQKEPSISNISIYVRMFMHIYGGRIKDKILSLCDRSNEK